MTALDEVEYMPDHEPLGEHAWVTRVNDLGDPYDVCRECGKQAHWDPQTAVRVDLGPE